MRGVIRPAMLEWQRLHPEPHAESKGHFTPDQYLEWDKWLWAREAERCRLDGVQQQEKRRRSELDVTPDSCKRIVMVRYKDERLVDQKPISLRLLPNEREQLKELMRRAGYTSQSAMLRRLVQDAWEESRRWSR